MGNWTSRQRGGLEELDIHSSSAYRYPPKSGNYFGSHFIMGGEKFDSPQPESFLFGENSDLNFLGCKPVPFPYPPPQANEPTKTLKSLVNLRRDSLHFVKVARDVEGEQAGPETKQYNIEFTFDCDVRVSITLYYFCTEEVVGGSLTLVPKDPSTTSPTFQYKRGAGQVFSQPGHVFCPELHSETELAFSPEKDMLPIAVHCVAEEGEEPRQSHLTIGVVERHTDGQFVLKALKQKLFVDGLSYLLQEIYGIENKVVGEGRAYTDNCETDDVEDTGAECVVCMSDMRDTLILPCRHLCLCNTCADSLRYQANNCPICRAPFRALLQIRALAKSGHSATHPALAAEAHTDGIPPGYELVSLVEALNGPLAAPPPPALILANEVEEGAAKTKKKSRRRGSRDKEREEQRRISAVSAPPPVEEPLPPPPSPPHKLSLRRESITIDMETGESSDLVQEELEREPEATTEDELLKDCEGREAGPGDEQNIDDVDTRMKEAALDDDDDDEETEIVSLRCTLKHSSSLPATPRNSDVGVLGVAVSSGSLRVVGGSEGSSQESADSVGSSRMLLSATNSPQVTRVNKSSIVPYQDPKIV